MTKTTLLLSMNPHRRLAMPNVMTRPVANPTVFGNRNSHPNVFLPPQRRQIRTTNMVPILLAYVRMQNFRILLVLGGLISLNCQLELSDYEERKGQYDDSIDQDTLDMLENDILLLQESLVVDSAPRMNLESMSAMSPPTLSLGIESSPGFFSDNPVSSQGEYFDNFCESSMGEMSINNAAWLSFFSANEYSHPFLLAPLMTALGFGEAQNLFTQCSEDVLRMQALPRLLDRELNSIMEGRLLGACGRGWFEDNFGKPSHQNPIEVPNDIARQFLDWLMQEPASSDGLEFFSEDGFQLGGSQGVFEQGSTQVMWAEHTTRPVVVITFRGTENKMADYLTDLKFAKTPLQESGWNRDWGEAHLGFVNAIKTVNSSKLLEKVKDLAGSRKQGKKIGIWVTGHSLGGALATLFAAKILEEIENGLDVHLAGLYTYGSPRVGNDDFELKMTNAAQNNNSQLVRIRNDQDTVTRLPFWKYQHVGKLLQIFKNDENDVPNSQFTYKFGEKDDNSFLSSVNDHDKVQYYWRLESLKQKPTVASEFGCLVDE